jgi:hypothetical protein
MKKISLLLISTLCALTAAAQTYSGGSGTDADPYLISSKADKESFKENRIDNPTLTQIESTNQCINVLIENKKTEYKNKFLNFNSL